MDVASYESQLNELPKTKEHFDPNQALAEEKSTEALADRIVITAKEAEWTLSCSINSKSHTIELANFSGSGTQAEYQALNQLCSKIEKRPIQEASDHACIELENDLRDVLAPGSVKGIVTPQNATPFLKTPLNLIRSTYRQYRDKTGYSPKWNFWYKSATESWKDQSLENRKATVYNVFESMKHPVVTKEKFRVESATDKGQITVDLDSDLSDEVTPSFLMALESKLQDELHFEAEVLLDETKDKNSKRRL
jgi:hypothetical protein